MFSSFISILFLNYNKGVLHSCNKTGLTTGLGFFFWILILQVEFSHFSTILDVVHALLPHKYRKSHACFEARSNKSYPEKYTECTYKHKKIIYIYLYIYIFFFFICSYYCWKTHTSAEECIIFPFPHHLIFQCFTVPVTAASHRQWWRLSSSQLLQRREAPSHYLE